jgi:hypothetical protein
VDRHEPAARALALLAALSSPVFLAGAIAAWVLKLWPANPLTLGVAAVAILGGPLLGLAHLMKARAPAPPPPAAPKPARPPKPAALPARPAGTMTPARARSLAFLAWRDQAPRPRRPLRSRARRRTVPAVRPEPKHDHLA